MIKVIDVLLRKLGRASAGEGALRRTAVTTTTEHGISCLVQPIEGVGTVAIGFGFSGGMSHDPLERPQTSLVAPRALIEAAMRRTRHQLSEHLKDIQGEFVLRAEAEAMVGCAAGPKANIDEIVRLSNQVLTGTEIPRDILDDVKRLVAGQIREQASDPDTKAQQTFLTALWAPHPYVQALLPSAEQVERASSADLADWLKANLALARLKVCVVGDLDEGQAASLVDQLFDNLPTGEPIGTLPAVEFLAPSRETIRVSTTDQHQAFIGVGGRSVPVSSSNRVACSSHAGVCSGRR